MKKIIKIFCLFCMLYFAFCTLSFAQGEDEGFMKRMWKKIITKEEVAVEKEATEQEVTEEEEEIPPAEPVTSKEAMIKNINKNLSVYGDEISLKIRGLVKKTDEEGEEFYLFKKSSGEEVSFEDLDEETLSSLYREVMGKVAIILTEKLGRQLEQLKTIENQRIPHIPETVTQPPKYRLPQTPIPSVPHIPEIPKVPAVPGGTKSVTTPTIYKLPEAPAVPRRSEVETKEKE